MCGGVTGYLVFAAGVEQSQSSVKPVVRARSNQASRPWKSTAPVP